MEYLVGHYIINLKIFGNILLYNCDSQNLEKVRNNFMILVEGRSKIGEKKGATVIKYIQCKNLKYVI